MQWYLLKTWAGREEELVREIRRTLPEPWIHECFVIVQERIWVRQKKNIIHEELLFPGCVFLTCTSSEPIESQIAGIPAIARWKRISSLEILRMTKEDGKFLEELAGKEHRVKLSCVLKDEQGRICNLSGPLKVYRECLSKGQSVGKLSESIYFMEDIFMEDTKLPAVEMEDIFTEDIKFPAVEMA